MPLNAAFTDYRLLLFYKGDISALTLFAQHDSSGSVCFPGPLPALSEILAVDSIAATKVTAHPSTLVNLINRMYALDNNLLRAEPGFYEQIDTPGRIITVYMARFVLLDPPHQLMEQKACRLKTLPELRGRPPAEMELLRRAYVKLMEG